MYNKKKKKFCVGTDVKNLLYNENFRVQWTFISDEISLGFRRYVGFECPSNFYSAKSRDL